MADLKPEGIHILAADGTVLRANLTTQKAGRARARDLSRGGPPVMLLDPHDDYRRLYVSGYQDKGDPHGVAAMRNGAFQPDDHGGPGRTDADAGTRGQQTVAPRPPQDVEQMDRTDLVEAFGDRECAVPASAFDSSSPEAKQPGIYAWWADEEACRLIGETLGADPDPGQPIYIGQTEASFVERVLRNHINGNGRSTFRVTLAAIMMTVGSFAAEHPDPRSSWRSSSLSDWIHEHLAVSIVAVDVRELNVAEREAFAHYDPPLNLRGLPKTPAREELGRLRKLVDPRRK